MCVLWTVTRPKQIHTSTRGYLPSKWWLLSSTHTTKLCPWEAHQLFSGASSTIKAKFSLPVINRKEMLFKSTLPSTGNLACLNGLRLYLLNVVNYTHSNKHIQYSVKITWHQLPSIFPLGIRFLDSCERTSYLTNLSWIRSNKVHKKPNQIYKHIAIL